MNDATILRKAAYQRMLTKVRAATAAIYEVARRANPQDAATIVTATRAIDEAINALGRDEDFTRDA
jgi:hypothetical protein